MPTIQEYGAILSSARKNGQEVFIELTNGDPIQGYITYTSQRGSSVEFEITRHLSHPDDGDYIFFSSEIKSLVVYPAGVQDPSGPVSSIMWEDGQSEWPTPEELQQYRHQDVRFVNEICDWFAMRTPELRDEFLSATPDECSMFQLFLALWLADAGL